MILQIPVAEIEMNSKWGVCLFAFLQPCKPIS